ncbi:MAG: hypothetical protein PHU85_06395 [Phycisphaerae bacterium]|nr:hypothetical protein [Phycisphaerae bacterium]
MVQGCWSVVLVRVMRTLAFAGAIGSIVAAVVVKRPVFGVYGVVLIVVGAMLACMLHIAELGEENRKRVLELSEKLTELRYPPKEREPESK